MIPAGIAKARTRLKNPGRNRSLFGMRARKNPGIPMVSALTSDRWRGRNGNTTAKTPVRTEITVEYTLLVRKTSETRSIFPRTRRPSATTAGKTDHLLSSRTSCATARVAPDPFPMAMPRSAFFSAKTSLTPSPVIATVDPPSCSASTICCFWAGVTRPNTECSAITPANSCVLVGACRASAG